MAERQFGPYRLVRQVAVGGMAEIHLAKTRGIAGFEKYVALKMIHPNFAEDEQFIQMLIDEAKIAVQLQHVNIAQTFDLGRVGDNYYITMEYVDGSDLYKILRRGSEQDLDVPIDVCAYVAKEVATGLDYAHRKKDMAGTPLGIVHRDVSPQNVLVSHAGEVKLVDFGIAKATMKVRQTAAGVIKGKYYYMSPEQALGDPLDHRSDIFSAGIVLYEMLTGQMLYLEEDLHRLLDMVRKADIAPPTRLRRDVPPQLERIVMHALTRNANERYQQAADMANDLERFLHTYSPVFTAAKLAKHLRAVMGDPVAITTASPEHDDPVISTLEIGDEDLLQDRSELRGDENSVIFRLDGLKQQSDRANAGANAASRQATPRPQAAPPPQVRTPPVAPGVSPRPPAPASNVQPRPAAPVVRPPGAKMELPRITQRPPGGTQTGETLPVPAANRPATPAPVPVAAPPAAAAPPARPSRPGPSRDPHEETRPVDPRIIAAATWAMEDNDDDLDGVGERTLITAPPGFEGAPTPSTPPTQEDLPIVSAAAEDIAFEATMIEAGWNTTGPVDEDGPTLGGDPDGPTLRSPPADDAGDDEDGPTMTRNSAVRVAVGAPSTARKPRTTNPALAASTPTPAVSELRKPARSRRTPAGGVPTGSVLQAIVGAAGSEPMPTRPAPGRGGPSDGVPPMTDPNARPPGTGPGPYQQQPQQQPPPQYPPQQYPGYGSQPPPGYPVLGQDASSQYPGQHQLPTHGMPPHLQPYGGGGGWPPQQQQHPQGLPPGFQPQGYPFQPQHGYPHGPTFTQQMRAVIELDEVPSHYKLHQSGPRWFVLVIAAVVAVAGAAIATYFILRRSPEPKVTAVLLIDSVPSGATVVVDGTELPHPTPVPFSKTAPGSRHVVKITKPGYRPYQDEVVVGPSGGEIHVTPVLQAMTGKILIDSTPPGAEIYIKGELRGRTPANLVDLEIESTKELELRHKDYGSRTIPLQWTDSGEIKLQIDLKK